MPSITTSFATAHGVGHDGDRVHLLLVNQLRDVIDIVHVVVAGAHSPLAVAVAPQIRSDDVIVVAKRLSDPVPIPAVIASAMDHQHRRRVLVGPVHIVEPEPLRKIRVGGGAFHNADVLL